MPLAHESSLVHAYDAAKRREYYLRTRKLKGRKKGVDPEIRRRAAAAKKAATKKALQAKVAALQARLDTLREVMKKLVAQAQAKSGGGSALSKAIESKAADSKGGSEKKTAKQEAAAKKASEKYAKTHKNEKDQPLSQQAKNLSEKIKTIEGKIAKLRAKNAAGASKASAKTAVKSSSPTNK